jgi:hypothetical protein
MYNLLGAKSAPEIYTTIHIAGSYGKSDFSRRARSYFLQWGLELDADLR